MQATEAVAPRGFVTKIWRIGPKAGGPELGVVKWFPAWRRYTFCPSMGTTYDAACLQDLSEFCETETQNRKEAR